MDHDRQEDTGDQAQAAPTPRPQWVEPGPVHPGEPLIGPQQAPTGQTTSDIDSIGTDTGMDVDADAGTSMSGQTPPVRPTPRWVEPVPGEREPNPGPL
jgi:hypothetical protein